MTRRFQRKIWRRHWELTGYCRSAVYLYGVISLEDLAEDLPGDTSIRKISSRGTGRNSRFPVSRGNDSKRRLPYGRRIGRRGSVSPIFWKTRRQLALLSASWIKKTFFGTEKYGMPGTGRTYPAYAGILF